MSILLSNASTTGSAVIWPGGIGMFAVAGTFGGATVALQFRAPDSSSWINAGSETTMDTNGGALFTMAPGQIRASVTGGAPSGLYASANKVRE